MKKKTKKVGIVALPTSSMSAEGVVSVEPSASRIQPGIAADGTRDYTYEEVKKIFFLVKNDIIFFRLIASKPSFRNHESQEP